MNDLIILNLEHKLEIWQNAIGLQTVGKGLKKQSMFEVLISVCLQLALHVRCSCNTMYFIPTFNVNGEPTFSSLQRLIWI